jgi:hypothetical protein
MAYGIVRSSSHHAITGIIITMKYECLKCINHTNCVAALMMYTEYQKNSPKNILLDVHSLPTHRPVLCIFTQMISHTPMTHHTI